MAHVPAEFRTVNQERIASYIATSESLLARSVTITVEDLVVIRHAFADFYRDALMIVGQAGNAINSGTVAFIVRDLSSRIEDLAASLQLITNASLAQHLQLARDLESAFLTEFLGSGAGSIVTFTGSSPELLLISSQYSADLIGLSRGGLTGRMLKRVNDVVRLASLGATPDAFSSIGLLNQALGGPLKWSFEAERIYYTETLRLHAMALHVSGEAVNELIPTDKIWTWSGIKRPEHARINGQRVPMKSKFRVPLRKGGIVLMKHPRDPAAAHQPSAVISCGCSMSFLPSEVAELAA